MEAEARKVAITADAVVSAIPSNDFTCAEPAGLPDLQFIKTSVAISDVAAELGLEVIGNMIRCWRAENHEDGDRTPSVGIDRKRNRVRCFVCDPRAYSAIDLVQKVLGVDVRKAAGWIAARFTVPTIPKGRHLRKHDEFRSISRAGLGGPLEMMIRSGLWAHLTPSEKAILAVLCELTDQGTNPLQLSYRGISRFSGVSSDSTIARVLKRFRTMRILKIYGGIAGDGLRACNSYELTLDDPELQRNMAEIYESERHEINAEREWRKEQRKLRQAEVRSRKPPTNDGERQDMRTVQSGATA